MQKLQTLRRLEGEGDDHIRRDTPRQRRPRDRQKAYRKRCAKGVVIAPVPVGIDVLDLVIRLGWLRQQDAVDRGKIGQAIAQMLDKSAAF